MKRGNELGIKPIKCKNREGTEDIRKIHMEINNLLYENSGKYINHQLALDIYEELCKKGLELKSLNVPERAKAKQTELLDKLRDIIKTLKPYKEIGDDWTSEEDIECVQKTINFWLAQHIKNKKQYETDYDLLFSALKENKRIWQFARFFVASGIKFQSFKDANEELLKMINTKFVARL